MKRKKFFNQKGELVKIGTGGVNVGDIVLYNRHVGFLFKDTTPIDILDETDLIVHTLFREPRIEPLSDVHQGSLSIVRLK